MEKNKAFLKNLGAIEKHISIQTPKIIHRVDVVYHQEIQSGVQLKLDLLIPDTSDEKPAILFLPGGGFTSADYHKTLPLRLFLAQKGYVVASAAYRPVPEQFPTLVHDAKYALHFLYEQAEALQITREQIVVMGDSAGGYLTQLLMVTAGTSQLLPNDIPVDHTQVAACVSLYGFSNLLKMTNLTQFQPGTIFSNQDKLSPEKVLLKGASADKATPYTAEELYQLAKQASPLHYVHTKSTFAPILLMHGDQDHLVPMAQSTEMYTALTKSSTKADYWMIAGADHGSVEFSQLELFEAIADWLSQQFTPKEEFDVN